MLIFSGKPNLAKLDRVDWREKYHAYGQATDVPELIAQLVNGNRNDRVEAIDEFFGNIFHQGTRYSATVETVPYLIDLLRYEDVRDRHRIMQLLSNIAVGYPSELVVDGFDLQASAKLLDPTIVEEQDEEDEFASFVEDEKEVADINWTCYSEVALGCPIYHELLAADNKKTQIAAAHLLAWFPVHGQLAIESLMNLVRSPVHPYVRVSAMLSLSHLVNPHEPSEYINLLHDYVDDASTLSADKRVSYFVGGVCFCLLRHYKRTDQPLPTSLRRLADVCLSQGVINSQIDPYKRSDYDSYPWGDVREHLMDLIRSFLGGTDDDEFDEDFDDFDSPFEFDELIDQLLDTTDEDHAKRLGRMLLTHAFGEKDGFTECNMPDRKFPIEDWNDAQREVLDAIAGCDACWPDIAFFIQEAVELDFEPRRDELVAALDQPIGETKAVQVAVADQSHDGPPSKDEVIAAAQRLLEFFANSDDDIEAELERFERFRPHGDAAVDMLVAKLQSGSSTEREGASWVLGRIGPAARRAIPALLESLHDAENDYSYMVFEEIGFDDITPLIKLLSHPNQEVAYRAQWAFEQSKDVPDSVMNDLLTNTNPNLRSTAIVRLRGDESDAAIERFFTALDDPSDDVRTQARYGLFDIGPPILPRVLDRFANSSHRAQRSMALVFTDFPDDLGPHTARLIRLISDCRDERTKNLLAHCLTQVPQNDLVIAALLDLAKNAPEAMVRGHAIKGLEKVQSYTAAIQLADVAEHDEDYRNRAVAVISLRNHRDPEPVLLDALRNALTDERPRVRLKAVWTLFVLGEAGVPVLAEHLRTTTDRRLIIDITWALGMLGKTASEAVGELERRSQTDFGPNKVIYDWAIRQLS